MTDPGSSPGQALTLAQIEAELAAAAALDGTVELDIDLALAELKRELDRRLKAYPGWVKQGRLKMEEAKRHLRRLSMAIDLLHNMRSVGHAKYWWYGPDDGCVAIIARQEGGRRFCYERIDLKTIDRPWRDEL